MSQLIPVPFAGEGSGVEELTWGQVGIWHAIQRTGALMNIGGVMAMPETMTLDYMVRLLSFVIGRHESLRTRLRTGPDGHLTQEVFSSGEAFLEIVDTPADGPAPADVAATVGDRFEETEFDSANEWPTRWAVIRQAGVITHLVVSYNHLALDGHGLDALARDLTTMDPDTGQAATPLSGVAPRELALLQRTPAHQRQSEVALRSWADALRSIPERRFGDTLEPQPLRFWELQITSLATHRAVALIVARDRTHSGHVLLALFAVALGRLTGNSPSVAQVLVSNRFRPGFKDSVSPLTQTGLCVIDVADTTFDAVVASAWRNSIRVGMNSYYDTIAHEELMAAVNAERGGEVDISCFFNDRRVRTGREDLGTVTTLDDVRAALPLTRTRWVRKLNDYNERLYLHVNDVPDTLDFLLACDTRYISPADMEMFGQTLEAVAVEAAADPRAPTGLTTLHSGLVT